MPCYKIILLLPTKWTFYFKPIYTSKRTSSFKFLPPKKLFWPLCIWTQSHNYNTLSLVLHWKKHLSVMLCHYYYECKLKFSFRLTITLLDKILWLRLSTYLRLWSHVLECFPSPLASYNPCERSPWWHILLWFYKYTPSSHRSEWRCLDLKLCLTNLSESTQIWNK